MSALTVTINNISPALEHKHSECDFILNALRIVETELGRGRGQITSGNIVGQNNVSLGSWTATFVGSSP